MGSKTLDAMKGIGIILVVIYHAINYNVPGHNGLYYAISSFFMAMFFIISGYLAHDKITPKWVSDKTKKLLLLIAAFTVIYWLAGTYFNSPTNTNHLSIGYYLINSIFYGFSESVLWYLWTLILCYFAIWALSRFRTIPLWIPALLLVIILTFIPFEIFGFLLFKWYLIYFLAGYFIKHYRVAHHKLIYLSLALFPVCIYLFKWMIPYQNVQYAQLGFVSVTRTLSAGQPMIIVIYLLMSFLGSAFVYSVARILNRLYGLQYLGKASLAIYLCHSLFIQLFPNYIMDILIAILASIIIRELYLICSRRFFSSFR